MQIKDSSYRQPAPSRPKPTRRPFGAPYDNSGSYTPATDSCPTPFVPSRDRYSPPASNADPKEEKKAGSYANAKGK